MLDRGCDEAPAEEPILLEMMFYHHVTGEGDTITCLLQLPGEKTVFPETQCAGSQLWVEPRHLK